MLPASLWLATEVLCFTRVFVPRVAPIGVGATAAAEMVLVLLPGLLACTLAADDGLLWVLLLSTLAVASVLKLLTGSVFSQDEAKAARREQLENLGGDVHVLRRQVERESGHEGWVRLDLVDGRLAAARLLVRVC